MKSLVPKWGRLWGAVTRLAALSALGMTVIAEGAVLQNQWLHVEIDEEGSGDIRAFMSRGSDVSHLRPATAAAGGDALLAALGGQATVPRGMIHQFSVGGKLLKGADLGPWKVTKRSAHQLSLTSADGTVHIDYILPEGSAVLTQQIELRASASAPVRYSSVANLQVGGDYRVLTEPTSDYVFLPTKNGTVERREALPEMKWSVQPAQPWFAVVDRNKNQVFGMGAAGGLPRLSFEAVNELDQESFLATITFEEVPPGEVGRFELSISCASGFSEVSYFSKEFILSRKEGKGDNTELSVLPLSVEVIRDTLVIEGIDFAGIPLEEVGKPHRASVKMKADRKYNARLKTAGGAFSIHPTQVIDPKL